jgi:hypothetical protein
MRVRRGNLIDQDLATFADFLLKEGDGVVDNQTVSTGDAYKIIIS